MAQPTEKNTIIDNFKKTGVNGADPSTRLRLLENMIMNAKLWIAFLDLKGRVTIWNTAAAEITGYSAEDVLGQKHIWKWLYPDTEYRHGVTKKIVDIIRNKKFLENFETEIRTKNGDIRRISWNTRELTGDDGTINGYIIIGNDITEIARTKQEIKRYAEFQESIIINAKLWMTFLDRNNNVVVWNRAAEEITGYSCDEVIGHSTIWKWLYPDTEYRKEVTKKIIDIIGNKRYLENFETDIRTKSGEMKKIRWNTRELSDEAGKRIGYIVIGSDITGIIKAKLEIQRNAEFQESIIVNAKLWMTFLDRNNNVVVWNRAAEEITGYSCDEVIGHSTIWKWLYPDTEYRKEVTKKIIDIISNRKYLENFETHILTKSGLVRDISWNTRELTGDEHERLGYIVVGNDITEKKLAEERLKHYNEDLEQGIRERTSQLEELTKNLKMEIDERRKAEERISAQLNEKTLLLREIHHRVKNNLQIIISLLNLQSRYYIGDEVVKKVLLESQNRVKAMSFVHEKLYQTKDISQIDFNNYIQFLVMHLFSTYNINPRKIRVTNKTRNIVLDLNTAIPVGLILNELISNILQHAFPDEREGEITISAHKTDGALNISVSDNGIGLPEKLDWRELQTVGLRLAISLVDQLDGTIELDRSAGTAFKIVVPVKE
ncbi:MAG: PAS domain S-box protein [Methanoregula sp.]|nr:PAS domain S-box protein [Methanoregula sp.]